MKVLGFSGSEREAAAAVSIDGEVAAAVTEESVTRIPNIGYRYTGGWPVGAIAACFDRAGLTLSDIDRVLVVKDGAQTPSDGSAADAAEPIVGLFAGDYGTRLIEGLRHRMHEIVEPCLADARQVAAVCQADEAVIVVIGIEPGTHTIVHKQDGHLMPAGCIGGIDRMLCVIQRVTRALGCGLRADYTALERLACVPSADVAAAFAHALEWSTDRGILVHDDGLLDALRPLQEAAGDAPDPTLNQRVQQARERVAGGLCTRVTAVLVEAIDTLRRRTGVRHVGCGGALFSSPTLLAHLLSSFGCDMTVAAVPETPGRAIGAVLDGNGLGPPQLKTLALGPEFSETQIKVTLENCRLDYVYEPDWRRLLVRVSRMLSRGSTVAWFQGPMGFGPRTGATRGVLCDPSNRWARENLNRFLRHLPLETPLPVSMSQPAIEECLDCPHGPPFAAVDAPVRPTWRDRLSAALDRRQTIPVHVVNRAHWPVLFELLELHRDRTSVPGLITVPFGAASEPPVCSPRDAVRAMFSSAIDALVIGRFLLMKDYWLLRSETES